MLKLTPLILGNFDMYMRKRHHKKSFLSLFYPLKIRFIYENNLYNLLFNKFGNLKIVFLSNGATKKYGVYSTSITDQSVDRPAALTSYSNDKILFSERPIGHSVLVFIRITLTSLGKQKCGDFLFSIKANLY